VSGAALLPRFWHRALKARFRGQRTEIRALVEAIRPGEAAADVGAHKGAYLPWLSRAAGPDGRVYAFEPQPDLAAYLDEVCRAASLRNVRVEAAGVSDAAGTRRLHVPGGGRPSPGASFEEAVAAGSPGRDVEARVGTLDASLEEEPRRLAALKVDVEGHELAVFRGARGRIERDAPLVVFESEARHAGEEGVAKALSFFAERGYDGWFVQRGRLLPVAGFDPAVHQRRGPGRFWDAKDYCNNFVMRKARG
jgi:FkbM family methyltransferase